MKLASTCGDAIALSLLLVLLAASSLAQMPGEPGYCNPWDAIQALDNARQATYDAATNANANFQVTYEAKVSETNGLHAGWKSALSTRVTFRQGRLEEARRKSREIVSDVQRAANEAANSAKEAKATSEEVTRTVMLEIRPTYSECMNTMGRLTSASRQAASFTGTLDSCANGANLLAFQMIGAGDTCSAGLGPCNDVQRKRDEAGPESTIISMSREEH